MIKDKLGEKVLLYKFFACSERIKPVIKGNYDLLNEKFNNKLGFCKLNEHFGLKNCIYVYLGVCGSVSSCYFHDYASSAMNVDSFCFHFFIAF